MSGTNAELLAKYGMSPQHILEAALATMARKGVDRQVQKNMVQAIDGV